MLSLRILLLCVLITAPGHLFSQVAASKVRSITIEDGLPQGFVSSILQDKQGFMWFSTNDGLARYDGREFLVFQHKANDSNSISTNVVGYMFTDSLNRLWLLHETRQVDILDLNTGSLQHLSAEKVFAPLKGIDYTSRISRIVENESFIFYIFHSKDLRGNRLGWYNRKNFAAGWADLPQGEFPLYIDTAGNSVPLLRTNRAIYQVHRPGRITKWIDLPPMLGAQLEGMSYAFQGNGAIFRKTNGDLVLNTHGGLWTFDIRKREWQYIPFPPAMVDKSLKQIAIGPDDQIYLFEKGRIYKFLRDGSLSLLWINESVPNDIISIKVDRNNMLWASTNTFGIRKIDLNGSGFRSYPVRNKFAYDVLPEQTGISVNKSYHNTMEKESFIHRSALDRYGNLWISNYIYDTIENTRLWPVSFTRITPGNPEVFNVGSHPAYNGGFCFDRHNRCWAVDSDGKLYQVNLRERKIDFWDNIGMRSGAILSMCSDNKGLWLIYTNAIAFYDPDARRSKIFRDQPGLEIFRNAGLLMAVADPAREDILWLCTRGSGLFRFDAKTASLKVFTTEEGIPNNTVYCAVPDKKGFLWCSSNKGIFRFDPKTYSSISFTAKDGLQCNEFNRYQYLQFNGKIIFGGTEGYTVFDPDSVSIDKSQPQTKLTGILVNNEPISNIPGWNELKLVNADKLVFNYDQNFLTFSFAALEYNDPEILQYRYQLEGVDRNWINIGSRNSANYTNLSPGKYSLKLNATNTAGIWSPYITSISIVIDPPWWRTWWAYALYVAVISGLGISFFRFRLSQAKGRQEMELKRKETEQLKAMDEMKSRFFSNITHEFRTPLSLIISPLEQITKDQRVPASVQEDLVVVQRNARQLLRLINQLLDMNKLEAGNMKASYSRGDISEFIKESALSFLPAARAKKVQLEFISSIPGNDYLFDADKTEKIVYNLLSNAVKFTPDHGSIAVNLYMDHSQNMVMEVRDTGIGIAAEKTGGIFSRFYQVDNSSTRRYEGTGIGLALVKELLDLLNGSISVRSSPGDGSIFQVVLPLKAANDEQLPRWVSSGRPAAEAMAFKPESAGNTDGDRPLVMVVEDNLELRDFITRALGTRYQVMSASNGKEALEKIIQQLPALVVSDVMMPEMDGFTLCRQIKGNTETDHISVILLTAKAASASVIEGLSAGADDYIAKPFQVEELLLRIQNILLQQARLREHLQKRLSDPDVSVTPDEQEHPFIQQLYGIIDEHLDDSHFSVEMLAQQAAVSSKTLNRKLSSLVGLSANELIRQYRLKRSLEFMRSGHSVAQSAYSVGFESHAHFSTVFKAFFGLTPTEFVSQANSRKG